MKNYIIIIVLLFPIGLQAQSLEHYLKEASENNPNLKSSYSEFEASLKRVSQVNALPDPSISFGVFVSPIETRIGSQRARVSLTQMFPWFGTLKAREDVATLQAEAKYQEFLNVKNELFFNVKKAYFPLYEIEQHIKWMEENLQILETYKQLSIIAIASGKGAMTDVLRVEIMMDELKTEIQLLRDKTIPYMVGFNRLLNRPDSSLVVVVDTLHIHSVDVEYRRDSLLIKNPMLESVELQIQANTAMIEVARKKGLPQFGVGLDYAFISKRTDAMGISDPNNGRNAIMPMVSMSLPIFRGKYKASVEEAELMRSSMEFKKQNLENNLFSNYESAWFELEKAVQLVTLYNSQMVKTEQMVDLLYVAYANSGKDFEEVLRTQQQLLKYQIALATTNTNFYIAMAQLDYITAKSE